jgi:hypothetical protein
VSSSAPPERNRLDELAAEQSVPALLVEVYDNRPAGFTIDHAATAGRIVQSADYELARLSSR